MPKAEEDPKLKYRLMIEVAKEFGIPQELLDAILRWERESIHLSRPAYSKPLQEILAAHIKAKGVDNF